MNEIEINSKLIIGVICMSVIFGIILWAGYNIYIELNKDENVGIEDFEGTYTVDIESDNEIRESDTSDTSDSDYTNSEIGDLLNIGEFEINNINSVVPTQGWLKRNYKISGVGQTATYYIPNGWKNMSIYDEKDGIRIRADYLQLDELTEETSYEDFLNKFIERKNNEFSQPNAINYSKRKVNINGQEFYVLVNKYFNGVTEYFCCVKANYVLFLEASMTKENYTQDAIKTVNEIYSTFRIF